MPYSFARLIIHYHVAQEKVFSKKAIPSLV